MTSAAQRPQAAVSPVASPSSPLQSPLQSPLPASAISLPTDLYSDEPPLETKFHLQQIFILLSCLEWLWKDRGDFFAAGNMTVYYSPKQIKTRDFRGPDFFVVLDTDPRQDRKSWVLWEEDGKYPNFIVEILSDSTAQVDRTTKKELYQNTWRVPEYFWFDPFTLEFEGFSLINGTYQPIARDEAGFCWSQQLGLYLGLHDAQLRYFGQDGELIPTLSEAAEESGQQLKTVKAEVESANAAAESIKAELKTVKAEVESANAAAESMKVEAESAKAAAESAKAEADAAKTAAQSAQAEAEELRQQLRALRADPNA